MLLTLCAFLLTACTTYDYDEELNASQQEMIRLHQEDEKIKEEIMTTSKSLDYLVEEMKNRVEGKLGEKKQELESAIDDMESELSDFLSGKMGDAESLVNYYENQLQGKLTQKEGEFGQALQTLQEQMQEKIDQGYQENLDDLQEGINQLSAIQEDYDETVNTFIQKIGLVEDFSNKLSELNGRINQLNNQYTQIMGQIASLQLLVEQEILTAIQEAKTSEAHTAKLQEFQAKYQELANVMQQLVDSYTYDDTWTMTADDFISNVEDIIDNAEEAIEQAEALNDLIDRFDPSKAEDVLSTLEDISIGMEELAGFDTSEVDEAETLIDTLYDYLDDLSNWAHYIESLQDELISMSEEAENFKNW